MTNLDPATGIPGRAVTAPTKLLSGLTIGQTLVATLPQRNAEARRFSAALDRSRLSVG